MPKYDDFELDIQKIEIKNSPTDPTYLAVYTPSGGYTDCPNVIKCK